MTTNWLDDVLQQVQKPGRYTGGEWNAVRKDPSSVKLKIALAFPDLYEVGMSYLGQKILYHILNSRPDVLAERVFAPWPDLEQALRKQARPLFSLENRLPLYEFDFLGFSLMYELNYSNILTMLDLGGIPLSSGKRTLEHPLVAAGGPAAFNPESVAEIFDFFLIGDGEEAFPEIVDFYLTHMPNVRDREELLAGLSALPGIYVPSRFKVFQPSGSALLAVRPQDGQPEVVEKRICRPFSDAPFPEDIIVPNLQVIHDRAVVEVERGCPQNCRFCQARQIYFPSRPKAPDVVLKHVLNSVASTGYEDVSLGALSVGDYRYLEDLISRLMSELGESKVALSLPSLRPEGLTPEVVAQILKVRKTGFTLVPEAGTERLRRVINKHLDDRDFFRAAETAFRNGWRKLKLYFMLGLPTETEEDVDGIAEMVIKLIRLGQDLMGSPPQINLSVASFIPKPHTPFQWVAMAEEQVLRARHRRLRSRLQRYRSVRFREHGLKSSILEAVFSRGDRRLGAVLEKAWEAGARFDSWTEHFHWDLWEDAFTGSGLDYHTYLGALPQGPQLPWDHIQTGVKKSHLLKELERAQAAVATPPCDSHLCRDCGGCSFGSLPEDPTEVLTLPAYDPGSKAEPLGEQGESVSRYRVHYSKRGRARYFSHNDLVSQLQRGFRRAGIPVEYSQGFHPKMRMSFGPALALGMEGQDEILEFRSQFILPPEELMSRINSRLPEGVQVHSLERLDADAASLSDTLTAMTFALELDDVEVTGALASLREHPSNCGLTEQAVMERRIAEYTAEAGAETGACLELTKDQLRLIIPIGPGKNPRPQDIVEQLLQLPYPAFHLSRETFILNNQA
ncbi:MAG: TIGR03960 family B12-binding radical SAM protein [Candidatus Aminicenantaceae bacterium]